MDVDPTAGASGINLNNSERTRIAKRNAQIDILLRLFDIIAETFPRDTFPTHQTAEIEMQLIDLDNSNAAAGILSTVFTYLRKKQNNPTEAAKMLNLKTNVEGTIINISDIVKKFEEEGFEIDFLIATPLMNIFCAFKLAFDETRTGATKVMLKDDYLRKHGIISKDSTNQKLEKNDPKESININAFGLTNQHICLLQGITFTPSRRTGLLRTLGPMTQCISVINETGAYTDKLQSATKNTLRMLPMVNEISNHFKDATVPGQAAGVLKELADILTLSTARSTQKIFAPIALLRFLWPFKTDAWSAAGPNMMHFIDSNIKLYKIKFVMRTGGSEEDTAQVIFHSIYGTYLEDLGILSQITTKKAWKTRREVEAVFTKRATKNSLIINPITFVFYSKMATSLLTKC